MQLKNGRLEVLELVALFLLKTETCNAKNSSLMRVFRRMFLITQFLQLKLWARIPMLI